MPTTSTSRTSSQRKKKRSKTSPGLDASKKHRFQVRLLKWYDKHGRDLPWRKTSDPYHILVSEVMLQQTQVDRVIPKYHEFLDRYPSFEELADAPVSDVKKTWYPLGYNIRPERLHSIACETVERYGGHLPGYKCHSGPASGVHGEGRSQDSKSEALAAVRSLNSTWEGL